MWNCMFDLKLKALGYLPCLTDACVYCQILNVDGELHTAIIAIHIDNSIVITSPNHMGYTIAKLLHEFDMCDLGEVKHFLGINFVCNHKHGTLVLNQKAYIDALVKLAGLKDTYPAETPMNPSTQLT
jgi:Reverse transcriptase (RNA-dependent DNA polymerase)